MRDKNILYLGFFAVWAITVTIILSSLAPSLESKPQPSEKVVVQKVVEKVECCTPTIPPSLVITEDEGGILYTPANDTLSGKVVRVIDGDTFTINIDDQERRVRMVAIDAPESTQPGGEESTQFLSDQLLDKELTLTIYGTDRYDRLVASVPYNDSTLNELMVSSGYAWFVPDYAFGLDYSEQQAKAIKEKVGLWASDNHIPPSLYRKLYNSGAYGKSLLTSGFFVWSDGTLHNANCTAFRPRTRWDGLSPYTNCSRCGGTIFDPVVLGVSLPADSKDQPKAAPVSQPQSPYSPYTMFNPFNVFCPTCNVR